MRQFRDNTTSLFAGMACKETVAGTLTPRPASRESAEPTASKVLYYQ
jgi:hypothetical protein